MGYVPLRITERYIAHDFRHCLIYLSGIAELLLAVGLLLPDYRTQAANLLFIMLVLYLPLHILDVFIKKPVMGTKTAAVIRLLVQFGLLFWVWSIR